MFQPETLSAREVRLHRRAARGSIGIQRQLSESKAKLVPASTRHSELFIKQQQATLDREARIGAAILAGTAKPVSQKERGMGKILALVSKVTYDQASL